MMRIAERRKAEVISQHSPPCRVCIYLQTPPWPRASRNLWGQHQDSLSQCTQLGQHCREKHSTFHQHKPNQAHHASSALYTKWEHSLILGVQLWAQAQHRPILRAFPPYQLEDKVQKWGWKQRVRGMPQFAVPTPPSLPPQVRACPSLRGAGERRWPQPGDEQPSRGTGQGLLPPADCPCS